MNLIMADGLTKTDTTGSVRVEVLKDLTTRLLRVFIGPSGSGKTTLLNLMGALDRPTGRGLLVAETDIAAGEARRGGVPRPHGRLHRQAFNLLPCSPPTRTSRICCCSSRRSRAGASSRSSRQLASHVSGTSTRSAIRRLRRSEHRVRCHFCPAAPFSSPR